MAYADFVTAMMALFIVLWLLSTNEKVKKAVSGYFQDPTGKGNLAGSTLAGTGEGTTVGKDDMAKLRDKIADAMKNLPEFKKIKDQVEMTVTNEGLRIEMLETEKGMFFESGNAEPTEAGRELLGRLSQELSHLPNRILVEGHTDNRPYTGRTDYTNWELSADRANTARRLMQTTGLRQDQVGQVRGYADQRLRDQAHPEAASNRRVSVIVQYVTAPGAVIEAKPGEFKAAAQKAAAAKPPPPPAAPAPAKPPAAAAHH